MLQLDSNTLIDNSSDDLKMVNVVNSLIANENCQQVLIATGYWDIPGTALVCEALTNLLEKEDTSVKILIGKDPEVRAYQLAHPTKYGTSQKDNIKWALEKLEVTPPYVAAVEMLKKYCLKDFDSSRIQIKMFDLNEDDERQFFHAKCYVFLGHYWSKGIIGSSNFTQKGLEGNSELNYFEHDSSMVTAEPNENSFTKGHKKWFFEKWDLAKPWNRTFLEEVLKGTPIDKATTPVEAPKTLAPEEQELAPKPFTPYELYIKLLQLKFGDIIDVELGKQIESYLPQDFKPLRYQMEAVKRCLSIMHEHGGFMLADVVGLGKTIVGVLVAKRFLTVPEESGRERRVLIVCPPAIVNGWKQTIAQFDNDATEKITPLIDFITTGSIGHLVDDDMGDDDDDSEDTGEFNGELEQKNYGLILIDESHKFRNSDTQMYHMLDQLIGNITFNTGYQPYIGLLSATPQNNRPDDLKNQIYLFERNRKNSTLKRAKSGDLEAFFADVSKLYGELTAEPKDEDGNIKERTPEQKEERKAKLRELSLEIRQCVLDDILERRTRYDIQHYYADDMEEQKITFPKISGPNPLEYTISQELSDLFIKTMGIIDPTEEQKADGEEHLGYYRYRAMQFFTSPDNKKKYEGRGARSVEKLSDQLASIMRTLLVKRMDSSFTAFKKSLKNLKQYTTNMIKMWDHDAIFICPQIDVNAELDVNAKREKKGNKKLTFDDCLEDIRQKIKKLTNDGRNRRQQNAEYHRADFKEDYLTLLNADLDLLNTMCDAWGVISEDPKLSVFRDELNATLFNKEINTSGKLVIFSEAADTVKAIESAVKAKGHTPLVITAANRDEKQQEITENFDANYANPVDRYDVIITTEVLAEGVNLHRANVILNYDTPWNATRLMQRIGRVNRIGSKEPCVYVYNFMPNKVNDAVIKLMDKAYTKLQSFHVLFGEDNKVFTDKERVVHYDLHEMVEGEESPMEHYIYELKQYREAHPDRYALIAGSKDGWEIASKTSGTAYIMAQAPSSACLGIRIDRGSNTPTVISDVDLLVALRVPEDTPRVPLPKDWEQLRADAFTCYNQYFVRVNTSRLGDKTTKAREVIHDLATRHRDLLTAKSEDTLKKVAKMVRNGNRDITLTMLRIGQEIYDSEGQLFPITAEEIQAKLKKDFGRLLKVVEERQGKPAVILGTCK